ncbi:MAG: protein-export chaperone SecB [Gammaproteobacteria bacterium]|nr:protein-export chaperone SecB [Gammaproteobacteria bacterium]|tara:strand:+ start:1786 stop:2223 length:438 start_codon:yes stop_codon:yes gene_type:complete
MSEEKFTFIIKKIFTKDVSFESPKAPKIFEDMNITPKVGFNLNSDINKINDKTYEIMLDVNVKAETPDFVVYLAEVKQAGIFEIENATEEIRNRFLNINCLEILYPYARENISTLVEKGGFPPLFLSPIDFASLYHQELLKRKEK